MEFASLEKLYQWLLNQVPVASENKIVPFHTERMRILQAAIGNPQDNYKIVHVTGSKGKGTVATMIASAFTECGAISGLYTSPHVQKWKERIRILPVDLLDKDLLKIANHVLNTVTMNVREPLPGDVNPTFFELTTLIAYEAYKVVGCDTAVLECGLGGLNDATNSIGKKAATVLTSIELEHMNVLGHSLAEITHQKMGIIREDVPLVVGRLPVDILSLILTIAEESL